MTPRVHLVVRHAQRVVPLAAGETVTAGRSDECALQLDDPSVSRRHCLFGLSDAGLRVTDLGSANGTFVNDRPVHEAAVAVGDVVRLGAAVIDVREQAGDEDALDEDVDVDDSTPHSVIERTIDPSGYAWLSPASGEAAGAGTLLLERAQRHLSALHRVSERLAASRDISSLTEATLRTILQVLPADRSAILLRRQGDHPGDGQVELPGDHDHGQAAGHKAQDGESLQQCVEVSGVGEAGGDRGGAGPGAGQHGAADAVAHRQQG